MIRSLLAMRLRFAELLLAFLITACAREDAAPANSPAPEPPPAANLPLIVYATMPASGLQPVFDAYAAETGKKVQLVSSAKEISAVLVEGVETVPAADLLLARGLSELWQIAEVDGFRPTFSDVIERNIPSGLRDAESRWTALGIHALMVVYNTETVSGDALAGLDGYAALGEERWRGRLCLSSSRVPGNRSLVAFLIRQYDLRDAELVVRNWRANLATNVFADDLSLINAIADGQCAIGIVGSDVLADYLSVHVGAAVAPHRFADSGSILVDASGGGVMRHARNPGDAAELLAWLTTNAPDALYAAQLQEFPANPSAQLSLSIQSWRDMVSKPASLSALGFLQEDAALLVERARYP
jgi:iron(III) transport system substrate-binding protein